MGKRARTRRPENDKSNRRRGGWEVRGGGGARRDSAYASRACARVFTALNTRRPEGGSVFTNTHDPSPGPRKYPRKTRRGFRTFASFEQVYAEDAINCSGHGTIIEKKPFKTDFVTYPPRPDRFRFRTEGKYCKYAMIYLRATRLCNRNSLLAIFVTRNSYFSYATHRNR